MITSLTAHVTRIAVGDCRDGILFFSYHEVSDIFVYDLQFSVSLISPRQEITFVDVCCLCFPFLCDRMLESLSNFTAIRHKD